MKYGKLTLGQVEAIVNILGGEEEVQRILRGEIVISKAESDWFERDKVIYFSVTSDGTTGEGWITRLNNKGFSIETPTRQMLRGPDFMPTDGVTYKVAVLKGVFFKDNDRFTHIVCAEAKRRGFTQPNAEVACLIREKFSDQVLKAMRLWGIVAMHEPIKNFDGTLSLLMTHRINGGRLLDSCSVCPHTWWSFPYGFAFVASQVNT